MIPLVTGLQNRRTWDPFSPPATEARVSSESLLLSGIRSAL